MTEQPIDPNLRRKSGIVDNSLAFHDDSLPLPSVIEISNSNTCNRSCSFCPRSDPSYPNENSFIDDCLVEKLAVELGALSYRGIILFSGFAEPLLHKRIYDHLVLLRQNNPLARLEMVTNGDVLSIGRLRHLFQSGLDTLLISAYDGAEGAEALERLCFLAGLRSDQYVIRHRYLPEDREFGMVLSNRSGLLENSVYKRPALQEPLTTPCNYPAYTFFMDCKGDVLLCPHDWGKRKIVGNLSRQSFLEIWDNHSMQVSRLRLAHGDRRFPPCNVCDVKGGLMGQAHSDAWGRYYSDRRE